MKNFKEPIILEGEINIDTLEDFPSYVPLREAVLQKLKKAILDGSLKPGQLLSENQIAEKLSVSRTPIREAIRILGTENLVTFLPGRKVIVSIPTVQDIEEVYEIRLIVETEALRRITATHKKLIRQMEKSIQLGEEYRKQGDLRKMGEMNTCFHLAIISALENQKVQRFIDSLHETISRFRFYSLTSEWAIEREKEHKEIVSFVKKGYTEKAISVLQQHLTISKENLITLFTQE
jgi:DNA-binding GntR family transcriptional regulator